MPCELHVRVLGDLPSGSASAEQTAYAEGLYLMWAAVEGEDDQAVFEPPSASIEQPPPSTSTAPPLYNDFKWCLPLEEYAGPCQNWPTEVLNDLRSEESVETATRLAAWGCFHSIPLDNLTDVLQGQQGCSGDPAILRIMFQQYEDLFSVDKKSMQAIALDEAAKDNIIEVQASPSSAPAPAPASPLPPAPASPSPPAVTFVDLTQESPPRFAQAVPIGPNLSKPEVLSRLRQHYVDA